MTRDLDSHRPDPDRPALRPATAFDRQALLRLTDLYLRHCCSLRTAARVSEFADFVAVDRSHLTRVFLHVQGRAPLDVLHDRRVVLAQALLRSTTLTTNEVAIRAAFGTRNTFYRIFLRRVGMTPDAWRKITK